MKELRFGGTIASSAGAGKGGALFVVTHPPIKPAAAGKKPDPVPVTIHIAIGTDIIHQHPTTDGAVLGEATYRDFQTFASVCAQLEGGVVLNIGSTVIVRGSARAPQYAAAKYGLLGVTKSYAHAFAPTVRVNVFAPGFIETEATLQRQDWKAGRGDQLRSLTPMARIASRLRCCKPHCTTYSTAS